MRSVDAHLADCLAAISPLPAREVALLDGLGCLLAEDVVSAIDLPGFDNSSMDGYAVRAAELATASEDTPVTLPVLADIPAGHGEPVRLEPGSVVRIMTGAPVPAGADAVVPVEWTDGGTSRVQIRRVPTDGAYLRRSGEDVQAGATVLRAGARLSSRQIALLAAVGRDRVLVRPRPVVLVMPSGSELVPPGKPLGPGQIHDSNGYGLIAAVRELGARAEHGGVIDDDPAEVSVALEQAARRADLVITTGGVSAGAYDTIKEVLSELGTVQFERVAMQPGMPQGFGVIGPDRTPIFTLPGNPVSALVSFEVFVRPALLRMAGEKSAPASTRTASAAVGWSSPAGKRQFVRARLEELESHEEGGGPVPVVWPVGGQGSHLVTDLSEANCLAVVPEQVTRVSIGDAVQCLVLDHRWPG
jgi:molybdopterin molybdotransferase